MQSKKLYGKPVSKQIKESLSLKISKLSKHGIIPKLSAILVGDDPASKIYVSSKHKTFITFNCLSDIHELPEKSNDQDVCNLIEKLNNDKSVHGILLQLPLPNHLDSKKILDCISPKKDVDGLHPMNLGNLLQGNPGFIPCTPFGCIEILKYYNIKVESKHIVIIGRSNLVGKPLMALLCQKFDIGNSTVTICHSHTKNLSYHTLNADIIIVAVGVPRLLTSNMVKENSVVIDVGINRIDDNSENGYNIVGDADYDNLINKVKGITPVPGGVGPMTITMLLNNTVTSAEKTII